VWETPAVVPITGIMAAGRSTVAELPAVVERIRAQTAAGTVDEILTRAWTDGRIG
jgi:phage I-like protein